MTHEQRMRQHKHNMLLGRLAYIRAGLFAIAESETTTAATKNVAYQMTSYLRELTNTMEYRVNTDNLVTKVKHKKKANT